MTDRTHLIAVLIRRAFDQYLALRPTRRLPGVPGPLAGDAEIDIVVVRENVEGEYSEVGGRMYRGQPGELASQQAIFTRHGIERIARQAFRLAEDREGRVVSATKSNGIIHTMPFWDEVVREVASEHPAVEVESVLIDALCARVVSAPESLEVIVASNLIANPIGQVWTGALMLEHLGHPEGAAAVHAAIETTLASSDNHTADLGVRATTEMVTAALESALG